MSSTYIIAEAGVNHNGSISNAKKLIDIAHQAGADAVKFQTWKTELLVSADAELADYQKRNTINTSQFEMLKKLELSQAEFIELKAYCDKIGIEFLSTPDEEESALFLSGIQDKFKVGSGELTNVPFLEYLASFGKPVILSTGMSSLGEIERALLALYQGGLTDQQITILHAVSEYPTPFHEVNLRALITLRSAFPHVKVGYSDHTLGIEVPIAAVAMGAQVIEKHFTVSRQWDGPDHKASLEPEELTQMVRSIRNIERALGDGRKSPSLSEVETKKVVRKRIFARSNIGAGQEFSRENLLLMRGSRGLDATNWDMVIGRKAHKSYKKGEAIE